jgi:hypothetical protein
MKAVTQNKTAEKEAKKRAEEYAHAVQLISLKVKQDDNIFGERSLQNAINNYAKAQEALRLYREQMNADFKTKKLNPFLMNFTEYEAKLKALQAGYTSLQGMVIKTVDKYGKSRDQYDNLANIAPQMFENGEFNVEVAKTFLETNKQITEEQRKQIKEAIEFKETYDAAIKAVQAQIKDNFGYIADDLITLLTDSISKGTEEWKNFEKVGNKAIENLGKQLIYQLYFADIFDKLQKDLENSMGETDPEKLANKQAEILDSFFNDLGGTMEGAEAFLEQWQKMMQEKGFDPFGSSIESKHGGITGMTQETAEELNGRFTALQASGIIIAENSEIIKQQLANIPLMMTAGNANLQQLCDIATSTLAEVTMIRSHTTILSQMKNLLQGIKDDTFFLR